MNSYVLKSQKALSEWYADHYSEPFFAIPFKYDKNAVHHHVGNDDGLYMFSLIEDSKGRVFTSYDVNCTSW